MKLTKFLLSAFIAIFANFANAAQPITIVVPYAPGSASDIAARAVQKILINDHKLETVIDYKLGAGGDIALNYVGSIRDAQTVFVMTAPNIAIRNATSNSRTPSDDLIPVAYLGDIPQVLVAGKHLNVNSVRELQKVSQSISYASAGNGSMSHIGLMLLGKTFKQTPVHVPYKGGSAMVPDLVAGRVDISYGYGAGIKPILDTEKVVALAVAGDDRLVEFPNLPTLNELGLKDNWARGWMGILANPTADKDTIKAVQAAIKSVADNAEKRSEFRKNAGLIMNKQRVLALDQVIDEQTNFFKRILPEMNLN